MSILLKYPGQALERHQLRTAVLGPAAARPARSTDRAGKPEPVGRGAEQRPGRLAERTASERRRHRHRDPRGRRQRTTSPPRPATASTSWPVRPARSVRTSRRTASPRISRSCRRHTTARIAATSTATKPGPAAIRAGRWFRERGRSRSLRLPGADPGQIRIRARMHVRLSRIVSRNSRWSARRSAFAAAVARRRSCRLTTPQVLERLPSRSTPQFRDLKALQARRRVSARRSRHAHRRWPPRTSARPASRAIRASSATRRRRSRRGGRIPRRRPECWCCARRSCRAATIRRRAGADLDRVLQRDPTKRPGDADARDHSHGARQVSPARDPTASGSIARAADLSA